MIKGSNIISPLVWKEIEEVLNKHNITYKTNFESRYIPQAMEYPDKQVIDMKITTEIIVSDYI